MLLNVHHLAVFLICNSLTVKPALEKHLLQEADVAGMQRYSILKQVASNGEVENLWTTILRVQFERLKTLNFEWPLFVGNFSYLHTLKISKSPQPGTLSFCRIKVLSNIFNCSNFECSWFSGLKVHSGRRKRYSKKRDAK